MPDPRALRPWLLPAYAVATLFPRLLALPGLPAGVQLTELLFPFLLLAYGRSALAEVRRFPWVAAALLFYCGVNLLAASGASSFGADAGDDTWTEAGARGYLAVLAFLALAAARAHGTLRLATVWRNATLGVALAALLAYGITLTTGWTFDRWVTHFDVYPYFGSVYRLRGPAVSYGMLYLLLLPGLLLAFGEFWSGRSRWAFPVIALAGLLTLGKENLLLPVGVLLVLGFTLRRRSLHLLARTAAAAVAALLLFTTHYLVVRPATELTATAYVNDRSYPLFAGYRLAETNYTENKRAALHLGRHYPWLGVGPGRFADRTAELVPTGDYPARFGRFDPHSTWTGALAETGHLGLLALLLFALAVFRAGPPARRAPVLTAILGCLLLASVFTDLMNFRQLWILLAWYLLAATDPTLAANPQPTPDVPTGRLA